MRKLAVGAASAVAAPAATATPGRAQADSDFIVPAPSMLQAIGDLLPIAVGISISPLPIIGLILLLISPRGGAATLAFVIGWIAAISVALAVFTSLSTLGLGNMLTLGITAGVTLGAKSLSPSQSLFVGILYVLVAASTVVLPTIAYFSAPDRMRPWLDELRQWLAQHNAALMAVLLAVIGANMSGKGLSLLG